MAKHLDLTTNKCIVRVRMTFWFRNNALLSLPHSFPFIHTLILSRCGAFFVIIHGLGTVPPLSGSLFYIVALTSLLTECYYAEQNKLGLCHPAEHISLSCALICWPPHVLYSIALLVPDDTTSLVAVLALPSDMLM